MPVFSNKNLACRQCQRCRLSRFTFTSIFAWDLASIRWLTRLHDVSEGERDREATKTTRCRCPVNHWQNSLRIKVWDTGTRNCRCCFLCVPVHLLHPLAWPAHPTGVTRCCIWWVAEGSGQGWIGSKKLVETVKFVSFYGTCDSNIKTANRFPMA